MKTPSINYWLFFWWSLGIILCIVGEVSWWVFILIVISHLEVYKGDIK